MHVYAVQSFLALSCFSLSLVHPRWLNCQFTQPSSTECTFPTMTPVVHPVKRTLTTSAKFYIAQKVALEMADVISCARIQSFNRRLAVMKQLTQVYHS